MLRNRNGDETDPKSEKRKKNCQNHPETTPKKETPSTNAASHNNDIFSGVQKKGTLPQQWQRIFEVPKITFPKVWSVKSLIGATLSSGFYFC